MMEVTEEAVERYLAFPYQIELIPDPEGWFVRLPELPGCMSQGDTPEEALEMIRDAQRGWITVALRRDIAIPEPQGESEHSYTGRFNVRVPKDVHRAGGGRRGAACEPQPLRGHGAGPRGWDSRAGARTGERLNVRYG